MLVNDFFSSNKDKQTKEDKDYTLVVSWLFLIGSLLFLLDSSFEIVEGISLHSLIHLSASFLFTVGSVLFIPKK
jgi:hypothetical protein